ncbi:hypothetical protein BD310DRAFT_104481 [Dichomitus squalens]|uniref:F-box domain-containing protein n=1 Tax=Dichomitus squalens TaxID=114155 RepID=A0A4Q9PJ27_9APHY|nr:hypothetical protein BD310DRAFT_104481 [Dichomitus squalens]
MDSPALPFDILLLIVEMSPRQTAAEMTLTCRTLRDGGARFLLQGVVSVTRGPSVKSLLLFLYSDPQDRFKYLRSLEVATGSLPPKAVDALLGLLSHPLLSLDSLILREADKLLNSKPTPSSHHALSLLSAFSALTTLRHLTVEQCDDKTCILLSTIQAPLLTISVDFTPLTDWHVPEDAEHRNPVVLLANISETLEELSGSNFAIHPDRLMYDVVYPSVRTIHATSVDESMPATLAYVAAFPNVAHLSFTSPLNDAAARSESFPARLSVLRAANKEAQRAFGRTWKCLEEVTGNVFDVFALGLACHVPRLRIIGDVSAKLLPYVRDALEDTLPTSLAVTIAGATMFADGTVANLLRAVCAQQVHELELELSFSPSEGDIEIQAVLNDVLRTLGVLSLRRLVFTIDYGLLTGPNASHRSLYGWFCPAEKQLDGLDMDAVAELFRAALPSLVDVDVHRSIDRTGHEHRLGPVGDEDLAAFSDNEGGSVGLDDGLGHLLMEEDDDGW